jgi:hypothetical protein
MSSNNMVGLSMDFEQLKKEEAAIIAEYNERYEPRPYRQVFYPPAKGNWEVDGLYVDSFFEAAMLRLEGIVAGRLMPGIHGVAAVFLCRHYLELEIKFTLFHSRWLKHEDENATESEIKAVGKTHKLQPYWDLLIKELGERTPSALATGLDLDFVGAFVAEFHGIDEHGWRFRYPHETIGVASRTERPAGTLGIDYESLLFNLKRAHDVLDTLDGRLIEQHGQNAEWESEMNSF